MSLSDEEDENSSICAIGFSSSSEPNTPTTPSVRLKILEDSSPSAVGFSSDSEKLSPAVLLQIIGKEITIQ
jgi:hypothetical protein